MDKDISLKKYDEPVVWIKGKISIPDSKALNLGELKNVSINEDGEVSGYYLPKPKKHFSNREKAMAWAVVESGYADFGDLQDAEPVNVTFPKIIKEEKDRVIFEKKARSIER